MCDVLHCMPARLESFKWRVAVLASCTTALSIVVAVNHSHLLHRSLVYGQYHHRLLQADNWGVGLGASACEADLGVFSTVPMVRAVHI
jgi:hypothetical protein